MPVTATRTAPTPSQVTFVRDLIREINTLDPEIGVTPEHYLTPVDFATMRRRINTLIALRDRRRLGARRIERTTQTPVASVLDEIPQGFYAIDAAAVAGVTTHQTVLFVAVVVRPDRYGTVRRSMRWVQGGRLSNVLSSPRAAQVTRVIQAQGVVESARRYASEIGRCYVCNTRLTDDTSRALGIGPDCRGGGTARGAEWARFVAGTATASLDGQLRTALTQMRAEATDPARPTEGTCSCGEVAIGAARIDDTWETLCDECAIDRDVPLRLFTRNPRLTVVAS